MFPNKGPCKLMSASAQGDKRWGVTTRKWSCPLVTSVGMLPDVVLAREELQPPFITLQSLLRSVARCCSLRSSGCDSCNNRHFQKSLILFSWSSTASIFEKLFFFSLYGVVGDGAQQVLGCVAAWMSSDFCVEQKIRVRQLCVFISPPLKNHSGVFNGGVVFPRINVLF